MKLMLLHLSDLHITGNSDVILTRNSQIVDAVKNLEHSLDMCVVVVTGDIAYSGTDDQYLVAMEFFDSLRDLLIQKLSEASVKAQVPVSFVMIPGNHDCDFSSAGEIRELAIKAIFDDRSKSDSSEYVQLCTSVQNPFFEFQRAMDSPSEMSNHPVHQEYDVRLAYEYILSHENVHIKFLCFNTAWLSQLQESQGHLYFPVDAVTQDQEGFDLVVAGFHHPYNWIESNAAREFRNRVESAADVILTGHEHAASRRDQEVYPGRNNICVEGGVLQDNHDPAQSEFNLFIFDTTSRQQKFATFRWAQREYTLTDRSLLGDEGGGLGWTDYRINESRTFRQLRLSAQMQSFLNDPGITILHRTKGLLKLQDIFLYPDLVQMRVRGEMFGSRVVGDRVRDLLMPGCKLLITGDTESGKTCLAKRFFLDLLEDGVVPVLLQSDRKPPTDDRLFGHIESLFVEQYNNSGLDYYRQLDKSSRAIIVDDFDKLQLTSTQRKNLLTRLTSAADFLIVFSHDITSDLDELTSPGRFSESTEEVSHYRIQPLGFVGRNKLTEHWMSLGSDVDSKDMSFVRTLARVNETLNTLVGKNYVPSYPLYVLSVLQAFDAASPIDINANTHGYFYELFIRTSLARGRSNIDFDIIASYLAHLAYQLLLRQTTTVSESELQNIHEIYEERYDIKRPFVVVKQQLLHQNILVQINDSLKFKYTYLYNYFVASYFKDHITDEEIRIIITNMCHSAHIESNANILLFLAHLSRDPMVIGQLLSAARSRYADFKPTDLKNDIVFLNDLGLTSSEAVYKESDPQETREAMLVQMDQTTPPDVGSIEVVSKESDIEVNADDPIVQFVTALRHLEILGQILKNFPGSLEGEAKREIARECYDLGLRALSVVFEMIRAEQEEILNKVSEVLRRQHPSFTSLEIESRAKETFVGLAHALSYGMIKKVAQSVGSPELSSTFERLLKDSGTAAYRLINSALDLDHKTDFPSESIRCAKDKFDGDPLAMSLLRHLVISHFHLFPVDFRTKQSICAALKIEYAALQRSDPMLRMLPRPTSQSRPSPRNRT